jgi:hypothetical protein
VTTNADLRGFETRLSDRIDEMHIEVIDRIETANERLDSFHTA